LVFARASLILTNYFLPLNEALYATEIWVKYVGFFILFLHFTAFSNEENGQFEIQKLKEQEVVLNEIVFLYKLAEIRKVAFDDGSEETIKKIDSVIFLIIRDNLIYQPEFNKEFAVQVLEFLNVAKYHQFTWSADSNKKLHTLLNGIE
jgi:hypothetical protein